MTEAAFPYNLSRDAATVRLNFLPAASGQWPVELVADWPGEFAPTEVERVVLTGRGAVWMYAAAAARAAGLPLAIECADSSRLAIPATVGPTTADAPLHNSLMEIDQFTPPGECLPRSLIRLNPHGGQLPQTTAVATAMRRRAGTVAGETTPSRLILTGRAPVWAYAAAAAGAADGGAARIDCFLPRSGLIRCDLAGRHEACDGERLPEWLLVRLGQPTEDRSAPGLLVGVVGDPNSGKSVLVSRLDRAVATKFGSRGWVYDCDAASPTPGWYLDLVRAGREAEAAQRRSAMKQPWSDEMEEFIKADLHRLRRCLQFVVADLPGGDHRCDPPQRIPPGRERIMKEIDGFLILAKSPAIETAWRQALTEHGLAGRIVGVVESTQPEAAFCVQPVAAGRWRAEGLRRTTTTGSDKPSGVAVTELVDWLVRTSSGSREPGDRSEPSQ